MRNIYLTYIIIFLDIAVHVLKNSFFTKKNIPSKKVLIEMSLFLSDGVANSLEVKLV